MMKRRSFIFGMLLSTLTLAFTYGVGMAGVHTTAVNDYKQEFLVEDTGPGSALSGPQIDKKGVYYFVRRNAAGTESYILKNYSNTNKEPEFTISGNIELWNLTPEGDYLYYTLSDENESGRLYRRSLIDEGAPVYKKFQIDSEKFLFSSITLAKSSDEFFLMSPIDSDGKITIGLFSFSNGNAEPIRTWSITLPSNWKEGYSRGDEPSYSIQFEAATDKIWLIAQKHYELGSTPWYNLPYWFFFANITEPTEPEKSLTQYIPSKDIPGWTEGNFKYLTIGRYFRNIVEFDITSDTPFQSIQRYDLKNGQNEFLVEWTNSDSKQVPITEWYKKTISTQFWSWDFSIDIQGNLYALLQAYPKGGSTWDATFQRFARFNPLSKAVVVEKPDSAQSVKNKTFTDPAKIVLEANDFKGPDGYIATGSRWRVFRKTTASSAEISTMADFPIYDEKETNAPYGTHTLMESLPDGSYDWQMAYDWKCEGKETFTGSTNWSSLSSFAVEKSVTQETPEEKSSGGGGCEAGTGVLGLFVLIASSLIVGKNRKK
ncbi:MAG: hypothetical protein LBJ36_05725 [Synergistaceae bacterium]|nr:hypothetical protein [Synergistaceae bacterium]